VAVLGRLSPFPVSAAPVSPLSGVGVEGVGVSPFVGGVGFGSSFSETIPIATLQSSSIVTVLTTFPSASVTVYSPFGNLSRSTIVFTCLSVVIFTVVLPSVDVNVYVLSLDGLPSSVTVISTSSHTFGSSGSSTGTITFATLSSQFTLYSTSISPTVLPSLSFTVYLPSGKFSRSNVTLPFLSVFFVIFLPSSDSNVYSSSVTGLPSSSSTSTINFSQSFVFVMLLPSYDTSYPSTASSVTEYLIFSPFSSYLSKLAKVYFHLSSAVTFCESTSSPFAIKLTVIDAGNSSDSLWSLTQVFVPVTSTNSITPASHVGSIPSDAFTSCAS